MTDVFDMFGDNLNLMTMLENDELFKEVCKSLPKEQSDQIKDLVIQYMKELQNGFFNPIHDIVQSEEFQEHLNTVASSDELNSSKK